MASEVPKLLPAECNYNGWSYTPSTINKYQYAWTIDNFSTKTSNMSSNYLCTGSEKIKWYLNLHMNSIAAATDEGYYSIYLYLETITPNPSSLLYKFSIINNNGEQTKNSSISEFKSCSRGQNYGINTFITKRELMLNKNELLPNGRLTIFCEIEVIEEGKKISGKNSNINFNVPKSVLLDNFNDIFHEKKYWDVEFIVGPNNEKKFQAHKVLLTGRSSVFLAMFENDTEESKNNQVKITNFSPEIFNEMLRFIYTDNVEDLDCIAKELLVIANYYNLEKLKIMCEESLYKTLTIENAAETLISADMFNANTLKIHTINFVNKYAWEFIKTSGYQLMKETHAKLAAEIVETFKSESMTCPVTSNVDHLLLKTKLSDVVLVVDDEEIPAHKLVLAGQSPVFLDIFTTSAAPNRIIIKDIQSDTMKEVLTYLYTGDFCQSNDTGVLLKVLAVAETYGIIKLKELCAKRLEKNLNIDTVVSILIEAEDYNVADLFRKALNFIQLNRKKVMDLDNFKKLCGKKPEVLFKILQLDLQK